MEFKNKIEEEVYNAMATGQYPVADLDLVIGLNKLNLFNSTIKRINFTNEILMEYLSEVSALEGNKDGLKKYLIGLKNGDIIDNQRLERENSFLIGLHMQSKRESALDKMIANTNQNVEINSEVIKDLAVNLLYGTTSQDKEVIRTMNTKVVGQFVNGERQIDYFPIDYRLTEEALTELANLYNERLSGEVYDNVLVQPIIIHGLFGALQIFGDGNTRMGRIFQHILLWQLINERTDFNFEMPPLYATRCYYPYRGEYRKNLANLVKQNDDNAWNEWILFNLKRIEDKIYQSSEDIMTLKREL